MKNPPKNQPKTINIDSQNLIEDIKKLPFMIEDAYKAGQYLKISKQANKILVLGMGGSAIGGQLLQNYLENELSMPIFCLRNYELPKHVDDKTLVFACSYSGNTEETLNAFKKARMLNCQMIVITSGGKLLQMAESAKSQVVPIPKGMQPRSAFPYFFFPMIAALENARLIPSQTKKVNETIKQLKKEGFDTVAKQLAAKIYQATPIIYASDLFSGVAYRWKTQFNENAKIMSYHHVFPEMNHNELTGFENPQGKFHIIMLQSALDHRRIQKRMKICEKIFRRTSGLTVLNLKGTELMAELFTASFIGDLVSYYLALLYKVDPSPVKLVEELKKDMGPFI